MSFTQGHHAYLGVSATGLNKLFAAYFTSRPRHLVFGTPGFVAHTTRDETAMQPIRIADPAVSLELEVKLTVPVLAIARVAPGRRRGFPGRRDEPAAHPRQRHRRIAPARRRTRSWRSGVR